MINPETKHMQERRPKVRKIKITAIYPPQEYRRISPGETLLSFSDGRLWHAIKNGKGSVSIIPHGGGFPYNITESGCEHVFGRIDLPPELNDLLSARLVPAR